MKRLTFYLSLLFACGALSAQTPAIFNEGVVNGASFQKGSITPGSLITIFGSSLATKTAQADTIPLSNSLGGVTVQFVNGATTANAPMLFVTPDNATNNTSSQINAQVPWNLVPSGTTATVNVIVSHDGVSSTPTPVTVGPFSPGIFASSGRAIAVNQDGTLAWPAGVVPGLTTHSAKPGDVIIIYATGLGSLQEDPPADGAASLDKLRHTLVVPTVLIGGIAATVQFSGLSPQFVGVNQLNVVIPTVTAGDSVKLQLMMNGVTTSDSITMAVGAP